MSEVVVSQSVMKHATTSLRSGSSPFGEHGQRMYRTGDLGLQLPSGDLAYLGRADTQVKVRGFRVECAEIEVALMRLNDKAIHAAAVVARNLGGSDSVLVAYLVGDSRICRPRRDPSPPAGGVTRVHDSGPLSMAR